MSSRGLLAGVTLACAVLGVACSSEPVPVPTKSAGLPDQCNAACSGSQYCSIGEVRFGLCKGTGPELCEAGAPVSECSGLCVSAGVCVGAPNGCSPTDCDCIVRAACSETNNNGARCGGYCDIVGAYAQVACLSCS